MNRVTFALRVLCCALLATTAHGQSERGAITGVVHDPSGAVVPNAKITVTNALTNVALTAATNSAGEYTVPNLAPGTYSVRVDKDGFRPTVENNLVVDA